MVLVVISPNEIEIWEAVVTLISFPVLVVNSYLVEKNCFLKKAEEEEEPELALDDMCKLYCYFFGNAKSPWSGVRKYYIAKKVHQRNAP